MNKKEMEQQCSDLTSWFDTDYTRLEQKYKRLIALNRLTDDLLDPKKMLDRLYYKAETVRAKINQLEKQIESYEEK